MESKLQVPFPPDPNPKTPRFRPPPGTCDTHFHIMGPPEKFPWAETRLYTPPAAPVEHYLSMAKIVGIERGVVVVPAVQGFDNSSMHDAIAKADGRLKGMVRANTKSTPAENKALHAQGVRGIRFNMRPVLAGKFDADEVKRVVSAIRDLPWCVCMHIDADDIVENAELISSLDMPTIIDHFGQADPRKGVDQPIFRVILDLMGNKNMWMKISGADRQLYAGCTLEQIVPMARALIAKAPDRIIWGTDWPHAYVYEAGKQVNDGDLMNWVAEYAPDEATRKKILVDNPARLFGF
jgi:predicted TIM-barrel fold metal-dependent hydrolase